MPTSHIVTVSMTLPVTQAISGSHDTFNLSS